MSAYMQRVNIPRNKLQLCGVVAMLLASKYEDMYPPVVKDFSYITANAYTPKQIIEEELNMLQVLDFSLEQPLPLHFLDRYVLVAEVDGITHEIAKYLLELCLVHGSMVRFLLVRACVLYCTISSRVDFVCHASCHTEDFQLTTNVMTRLLAFSTTGSVLTIATGACRTLVCMHHQRRA